MIYNRCSTEEESQRDALAKQVQESRNCVREHGWELTDSYVEARSGTTRKGRAEYNRLYRDLEGDGFDIIVIKSQDRLMRNTKDWYLFLDRMQKNQKQLFMYLENKFYTPSDALVTGIKAILAEEYSRELSRKINHAHQNRQREGKSFVFTNRTYGLKKTADGSVVIDDREAEMVRMIFRLSADGYGSHCSARILYEKGFRNRSGKMLSPAVIHNIIKNPIYMGTVVQNRKHYEFESKKILPNPPSQWVVHAHALPAIVEEALFEEANRRMRERKQGKSKTMASGSSGMAGRHGLTGKLQCGLCGFPYYRTTRQNRTGKVAEWKCSNYLQNGRTREGKRREGVQKIRRKKDAGCDNIHLSEAKLLASLERVCGMGPEGTDIPGTDKDRVVESTMELLEKVFLDGGTQKERGRLETALQEALSRKAFLLEKFLEGIISDQDYKQKSGEVQEKIEKLQNQKEQMETRTVPEDIIQKRLDGIRKILKEGVAAQAVALQLTETVEKIRVYPQKLEIIWADRGIKRENGEVEAQSCSTSNQFAVEAEKRQILEILQKRPRTTAKDMAKETGMSLSRMHARIRMLKAEGKIRYSAGNGRGEWIVTAK